MRQPPDLPSVTPRSLPLSELSAGRSGRVRAVIGDGSEALALRRMGLCIGRRIEVVRRGDPMIVGVHGARIGVARRLASAVTVQPCPTCGEAADGDA